MKYSIESKHKQPVRFKDLEDGAMFHTSDGFIGMVIAKSARRGADNAIVVIPANGGLPIKAGHHTAMHPMQEVQLVEELKIVVAA